MRWLAVGLHVGVPAGIVGGVNFSVDNAQRLRTRIPSEVDGVTLSQEERQLVLDLARYGRHFVDANAQIDRPRVWSALVRSGAWSNVHHLYQGSSLGMPVRGADLGYPAEEFANLSVFAAGLCDHIGSYFRILKEGIHPHSITLEIAAWTLTTGTSVRRNALPLDAEEGMRELGLLELPEFQTLKFAETAGRFTGEANPAEVHGRLRKSFDTATTLFSIPYWRENVSYLASERVDGDRGKSMFDRSMSQDWSEASAGIPEEAVRAAIARKTMREHAQQKGNGSQFDYLSTPIQEHLVLALQILVDRYQSDGVEVRFYLPSAHEYFIELEQALAAEKGQPFLLDQTTDFMRKFAQDRGLGLLGRESRSKPGGHFIDDWHQRHLGVAEDIAQVLNAPRSGR